MILIDHSGKEYKKKVALRLKIVKPTSAKKKIQMLQQQKCVQFHIINLIT